MENKAQHARLSTDYFKPVAQIILYSLALVVVAPIFSLIISRPAILALFGLLMYGFYSAIVIAHVVREILASIKKISDIKSDK